MQDSEQFSRIGECLELGERLPLVLVLKSLSFTMHYLEGRVGQMLFLPEGEEHALTAAEGSSVLVTILL